MHKYLNPGKYWKFVRNLPADLYRDHKWWNVSYGQLGEDLILQHHLPQRRGFYIDVGANHPKRLNNTYLFYKKNWSGINVETNPQLFRLLKKYRPRDTNLNIGIGAEQRTMEFFVFAEDTLSTFSATVAQEYQAMNHRLLEKRPVAIAPLAQVLAQYAGNRALDILSVDTEGSDLEVLTSNDWKQFRPKFVVVETLEYNRFSMGKKLNSTYDPFFMKISYSKFADTYINTIYVDEAYARASNFDVI